MAVKCGNQTATCFPRWCYNCYTVSPILLQQMCLTSIENKFLSVSDCPSKPCPRYPVRVLGAINHHVSAYSSTSYSQPPFTSCKCFIPLASYISYMPLLCNCVHDPVQYYFKRRWWWSGLGGHWKRAWSLQWRGYLHTGLLSVPHRRGCLSAQGARALNAQPMACVMHTIAHTCRGR